MKSKSIFKCALTGLLTIALSSCPVLAKTNVHFLDVGQGLSVLMESQGHYLLYDGGDSDKSSFVVSYLKQANVPKLDYVIASHYDSDHLNGVVGTLNTFNTKQVFAPDYQTETKVFRSFQSIVSSKAIPTAQPAIGTEYILGDATFQIISPSNKNYSDANNYSIGIRLMDGNKSLLITGDAEMESEKEMLKTGLTLDSDVYVAGHHGSATSSSWNLLQKVTPDCVVISAGSGNSYGHPSADALDRFKTIGADLYRTDKQGTILLSIDNNTLKWSTSPTTDWTPGDKNDKPAQPQTGSSQNNLSSVFWTPNGKSYHSTKNCSTLKRSKTINSGSIQDAFAAGKNDPCNICVK